MNLIHFNESDPQGYIFYGQIFTLAHHKIEEIFAKSSQGWHYWFQNPEWAAPIRHTEAEYTSPLRVGTQYDCKQFVSHLGESSLQWTVEFSQHDKVCAVVKTTHVIIDRTTGKKRSIPEDALSFLKSQQISS